MKQGTELEDRYRSLIDAVKRAGDLLKQRQETIVAGGVVTIKSDNSIVTAADLESEKLILDALKTYAPSPHVTISEEGPPVDAGGGESSTWFLDPLDGTAHYAKGSGDYAVLLSEWAGARPVFSVVHYPRTDELYWAYELKAGWLVDAVCPRDDVVTHFCYLRDHRLRDRVLRSAGGVCFQEEIESTRALLDIAKGQISGTIIQICGHGNWDLAAPVHLVMAAGGYVSDERGGELDMTAATVTCRFVVAANVPSVGLALLRALNGQSDEQR